MKAKTSRRPPHQGQRKIGVRAWPAFVHQSWFWRQFGFLKQGSDGETRQVRGLALRIAIILDQVWDLTIRGFYR